MQAEKKFEELNQDRGNQNGEMAVGNREDNSVYSLIIQQIQALSEESRDLLPVLSNAGALLMEQLPELNWAGFYLVREGSLLLGPFQGRVACIRIARGRGVCGTAWERDETLLVEDVHAFPGHIACDSASQSEIVVPLHAERQVVGVLDIDSPVLCRFSEADRAGLEAVARTLEEVILWK